jgi:hypothetical protein
MSSGIPFIKIANRVEVNAALKGERVSGLPLGKTSSPWLVIRVAQPQSALK